MLSYPYSVLVNPIMLLRYTAPAPERIERITAELLLRVVFILCLIALTACRSSCHGQRLKLDYLKKFGNSGEGVEILKIVIRKGVDSTT